MIYKDEMQVRRMDYIKHILLNAPSVEASCESIALRWGETDIQTERKERAYIAEIAKLDKDLKQAISDKYDMEINSNIWTAVITAILTFGICAGFYQ